MPKRHYLWLTPPVPGTGPGRNRSNMFAFITPLFGPLCLPLNSVMKLLLLLLPLPRADSQSLNRHRKRCRLWGVNQLEWCTDRYTAQKYCGHCNQSASALWLPTRSMLSSPVMYNFVNSRWLFGGNALLLRNTV